MLLDEVLLVIEKLQERIKTHQSELRRSEALTRNVLVDPLLRVLGWDTEDPNLMMPEFSIDRGFADYALLKEGKPAIVVEAKSLGTPLNDAAAQGIGYCINDGVRYFAVTDGRQWEVYETHRPVPLSDKKVLSFDIAGPSAEVCLDVLALWRPAAQGGTIRQPATPLLEVESPTGDIPLPAPVPPVPNLPSPSVVEPSEPPPGWRSLDQYRPGGRSGPPREIRFPDGHVAPITRWYNVPEAVVKWLVDHERLDAARLPVQIGTRYPLAASPVHPSGDPFVRRVSIESLYMESNYNRDSTIRNTRRIIQQVGVGVEVSQFSVRF